jgi:hypothetical protein
VGKGPTPEAKPFRSSTPSPRLKVGQWCELLNVFDGRTAQKRLEEWARQGLAEKGPGKLWRVCTTQLTPVEEETAEKLDKESREHGRALKEQEEKRRRAKKSAQKPTKNNN